MNAMICSYLLEGTRRVGALAPDGTVRALTDAASVGEALANVAAGELTLEEAGPRVEAQLLAPIDRHEVWGAGVTYTRSRAARMDESGASGGAPLYDRVYDAERPELFFKATPSRVVGPGGPVVVRRDSRWTVPEPELALWLDDRLSLLGIGLANDLTARDIEGENPLYIPQAKIWTGSCALGPGVLPTTDYAAGLQIAIECSISRDGRDIWHERMPVSALHRRLEDLVSFLGRENDFPEGVVLLTGTGVVPPDDVGLQAGDVVTVSSESLGRLSNAVRA